MALSVMVSVPVRGPPAVGAKVTEIVQAEPDATLDPQLCVSAKSPDTEIEAMVSAAVPELVRVIACAALVEPTVSEANVRLELDSVIPGARATPVPFNETVCGDPDALSVIRIVPVRAPAAVGAKVTNIVQFAPAARLDPQL